MDMNFVKTLNSEFKFEFNTFKSCSNSQSKPWIIISNLLDQKRANFVVLLLTKMKWIPDTFQVMQSKYKFISESVSWQSAQLGREERKQSHHWGLSVQEVTKEIDVRGFCSLFTFCQICLCSNNDWKLRKHFSRTRSFVSLTEINIQRSWNNSSSNELTDLMHQTQNYKMFRAWGLTKTHFTSLSVTE